MQLVHIFVIHNRFDKEQKLQEGLLRKTVNKTERSKIQSQIEKRESLQMQFDDKVVILYIYIFT